MREIQQAIRCFEPRPRAPLLRWCREHVVTDKGRPFDHGAYPHLGAPGGPCWAYDDPRVRTIWLMWATRLGKSFFAQCCLLHTADCQPGPMLFASVDEKLAEEVTARTYKMLERCKPLKDQLKPEKLRPDNRIDLRHCQVHVAWSRSSSTLADKSIRVGHANEIDKWVHQSTSKEADPLKLFENRFKDHPNCKKICEGTPTIKKQSRIERGLLSSTNCHYWVPCPHCGRYQRLVMGSGKPDEPGIVWDKAMSKRSDPDLARRTARYRCAHCPTPILDHHRASMMRQGVWVPEGCGVDDAKARSAVMRCAGSDCASHNRPAVAAHVLDYLTGEQVRNGADAGYQLSSLYALSLSWGDIAAEFVRVHRRQTELHDFINSWLGETFEPRSGKTLPEQLGEKIGTQIPRGVVPNWARFLTVGADRQAADGGFYVFAVLAHGEAERCHLVEYGLSGNGEELLQEVLMGSYPFQDGDGALRPMLAFVDSGHATKEVYDFCRGKQGIYPCKGVDSSIGGESYRVSVLGAVRSKRQRRAILSGAGLNLVLVFTDYWETDLADRLDNRQPCEPGGFGLCAGAGSDLEFCEQLCNSVQADVIDKRGEPKLLWVKKDAEAPNDFRDAVRYGSCAAKVFLDDRGGRLPLRRSTGTAAAPRASGAPTSGMTRPDGRPWLL